MSDKWSDRFGSGKVSLCHRWEFVQGAVPSGWRTLAESCHHTTTTECLCNKIWQHNQKALRRALAWVTVETATQCVHLPERPQPVHAPGQDTFRTAAKLFHRKKNNNNNLYPFWRLNEVVTPLRKVKPILGGCVAPPRSGNLSTKACTQRLYPPRHFSASTGA